ncbi:MAG: hypothetical protein EP330_10575 [Deltaproteobacteria bacterium]|nr:MAG: hypothetical protein EP330_10575 [Deltaproteobacteria bacterium]
MSLDDAFAAPEEVAEAPLPVGVRVAQVTLLFVGLTYLTFAIGLTPMMVAMPFFDPELSREPDELKWAFGGFMGLFTFVCTGTYALLPLLGVFGLQRRAMWGWLIGVILGAMLTPSACAPFGLAILWGLFVEDTRKIYL